MVDQHRTQVASHKYLCGSVLMHLLVMLTDEFVVAQDVVEELVPLRGVPWVLDCALFQVWATWLSA